MEALKEKKASGSDPNAVTFKKNLLIEELLSLGNAKITPQIAYLIGDDVEMRLRNLAGRPVTSEIISDLVARKLESLGLIRPLSQLMDGKSKVAEKPARLSKEVLDMMSPSYQKPGGVVTPLALPRKSPVRIPSQGIEKLIKSTAIRDSEGRVVETAEQIFTRVARAVAEAESLYSPIAGISETEVIFYNLMASGGFLPEVHFLKHAGFNARSLAQAQGFLINRISEELLAPLGQAIALEREGVHLSFYVKENPDKFLTVYQSLRNALIAGGGRPEGYLQVDINNPAIPALIAGDEKLCIGLSDEFLRTVSEDGEFTFIHPLSGRQTERIRARKLFLALLKRVVKAETTVYFSDRLCESNPLPGVLGHPIVGPKGDCTLFPGDSIPGGYLHLPHFVSDGHIQWKMLKDTVFLAVHFLDNALDINVYPDPASRRHNTTHRKIALGVTGWRNCLRELHIAEASEEAISFAEGLSAFIQKEAENQSVELAHLRGSFPSFAQSRLSQQMNQRRHSQLTRQSHAPLVAEILCCEEGISSARQENNEWRQRFSAAFNKHFEGGVYYCLRFGPGSSGREIARSIFHAHEAGLKAMHFDPDLSSPAPVTPHFHGEEDPQNYFDPVM